MDRLRWSIYGYSVIGVAAAAMAGAGVLLSWQLAVASVAIFALGMVVLRLRDVEPASRDDRFEEILRSPTVIVVGLVGVIVLCGLAVVRGGVWLLYAAALSAYPIWRVVQRLRSTT